MNQTLLIVYSNLGLGGIPIRIVDIVNQMAISHPKIKIFILLKKCTVFDLRSTITNPGVVLKDFPAQRLHNNLIFFILWVWHHVFTLNPNAILSFISPYALVVLATKVLFFWRKTTILINEGHYASTMIPSMVFPNIQRWGVKLLYPLANTVIVPTRAIMKDLHRSFGIPTKTMVTIPNWSRYACNPITKTRRSYDIVYTGRFDKTKNLLPLLHILSQLIRVKKLPLSCLLVGEGPDLARCREFITSHKINKSVSIHRPTTGIFRYFKNSKIFLFYPDKKTEGFPLAVLDAMACGAIVISMYFSGIDEVISDNTNGFVVHTEKEMSNRIVYVLQNYQALRRIINRAKETVSRYHSLDNIHQYTQRFYV